MSEEQKQVLLEELSGLELIKKESDVSWEESLYIQDKIHNIKMKLNGVKPADSSIDCIGCGS
tara:strand:- start:165 stop:350 length:186 start_codon:yes stop_codon:yes gene_type:complete